ncbi:MAG: NAD(P)-dependent oxidoreductase [Sphaerochaetaceae bacterium]|nr:NAD(P)-dependent oxidoreductase [Sphaerochaetaceae bacterium]
MNNIKIGWIGTGVMGSSMCERLIDAGYKCYVSTRTKSKADKLIEKGATFYKTPLKVARECDIVFTMVGFPRDVEEVYFSDTGLFAGGKPGMIFCDMTTTKPSIAKSIYEYGKTQEIEFIDAPVSGGDVGAKTGTLSIMAGGDPLIFEKLKPFFDILGKSAIYEGYSGAGQHTKMANQITIAGIMGGVCEALLYSSRVGLDLNTMLDTIKGGAAACWTLDNLAPRIIKEDFEPGFYVDHFVKDMKIALEEAEKENLNLPTLKLVESLYEQVQKQGYGKKGTQALFLALEEMNKKEKE